MMPDFQHPWILFFIIPLGLYFVLGVLLKETKIKSKGTEENNKRLSFATFSPFINLFLGMTITPKWRKITVITARILLITLLVLSLSGLYISTESNRTATIFVADLSDSSVQNKEAFSEIIRNSVNHKSFSNSVGVVTFGTNVALEKSVSGKLDFTSFNTNIDGKATNMEDALKYASSLFPMDSKKRLILMTDGMENQGDVTKEARILKANNIALDIIPYVKQLSNEAAVTDIDVPAELKKDQRFDVGVTLRSRSAAEGTLRLYEANILVAEKQIKFYKGDNHYVFSLIAKNTGNISYSAEIVTKVDTEKRNNRLSGISYVDGRPKVLVVQGDDKQGSELIKILNENVDIDTTSPENVPSSIEELQRYDAFIACNVSAENLSKKFMANVETCVKDLGKGFLMTGGENSYGPGGFVKTPIEKILPVNMEVKKKKSDPDLGLMLVIDKSGSMSECQYDVAKVELAKEAAMRSTEVLSNNDMIGVLAFDDDPQWVVRMQKMTNIKKIQNQIGTIRADGGTDYMEPLTIAYEELKKTDTKLKHILLMTDGQAEADGYVALMDKLRKAGITLSTVAVGDWADTKVLSDMARLARGRYYETNEFSNIPKIFAKETMTAAKTYIVNESFSPRKKSNSEILNGLGDLPAIDGYVRTTVKTAAKTLLISHRDDPILATGQYGLGHTAAWTSDAAGRWTGGFLNWQNGPNLWRRLTSYILGKKLVNDCTLKTSFEGQKMKLTVDLPESYWDRADATIGYITGSDGKSQRVQLDLEAPGVLSGYINNSTTGSYIVNITIKNGESTIKSIHTAFTTRYSHEYDIFDKDVADFLQKLASEGGGTIIHNYEDVFKGKTNAVSVHSDINYILLMIAILVFLFEVAVRRLNIDLGWLFKGSRKPKNEKIKTDEAMNTSLNTLLERKRKNN